MTRGDDAATSIRDQRRPPTGDWVAEAPRRCFKAPKRQGELPATEACPEVCGTYAQCMRLADLEEDLADIEREQELAANSSCPEDEPGWLFSQIARGRRVQPPRVGGVDAAGRSRRRRGVGRVDAAGRSRRRRGVGRLDAAV